MEETRFQATIKRLQNYIKGYTEEIAILYALGEVEGVESYSVWGWANTIKIEPVSGQSARQVAINVLAALRAKGSIPTKATKTFDKETGKVTFSIPGPKAEWKIEVSGGEPRCKVVPVVESYMVPEKPAVAAHMATRTKYVIENPEECGAEVEG